jgi:ABC-2 type transport system ATP-binding protein
VVVAVEHLTKRYGGVAALHDVTFGVLPGTVTAFLGPNGSGKTTTLRILLGLVSATSGEARIFGKRYAELEAPARRVGAVLDVAAHPSRTARNHLRGLALPAGVSRDRVDELLDAVDLSNAADRATGGFSLGMRQRLALAAALLGDPELLVLDEPANGLDPDGIRWLREFLRAWADDGRTALLSSHVLAEVAQVADHVVIVDQGRVVLDGPVREVALGSVDVRTPEAGRLAGLLADLDGVVRTGPDQLRLPHGVAEYVGRVACAHQIPLVELHTRSGSLEDLFFALTAHPDSPDDLSRRSGSSPAGLVGRQRSRSGSTGAGRVGRDGTSPSDATSRTRGAPSSQAPPTSAPSDPTPPNASPPGRRGRRRRDRP